MDGIYIHPSTPEKVLKNLHGGTRLNLDVSYPLPPVGLRNGRFKM